MADLQRVQVILDRTQRRTLMRIAKREGRSMSAVLRDVIERGLAERVKEEQQWKAAMAQLRKIREAQRAVYNGDLIAEVRAERERQLESIWKQWS
ncbi:MAG TPA: hypothetical protein VFD70_11975 [Anaerolineae bacterium]|nr:hypothetical protein [Anaerolineae bacterium]